MSNEDNVAEVAEMLADSSVAASKVASDDTKEEMRNGEVKQKDAAPKKKNRKSKSGDKEKKRKSDSSKNDVEWEKKSADFGSDEDWATEDFGKSSPSTWDPKQFDKQTGTLDPWKESNEPARVQDLPSPTLAEHSPDKAKENEEEWPFKSPCKFDEKNKRRMKSPKSANSTASDIDSVGSNSKSGSSKPKARRSKTEDADDSKFSSGGGDDADLSRLHSTSLDDDEDKGDDGTPVEAWKMRESWKSSAHTQSSGEESTSRKGRKEDSDPSISRRGRGSRPDADEDGMDQPPIKPKARPGSTDDEEELEQVITQKAIDDSDRPKKPKRRSAKPDSKGGDEKSGNGDGGELGKNSFHRLAKDFDKPGRSSSKGRKSKSKTPTSAGRRRRVKDKALDHSGHDDDESEGVYEEFGEEEHEIKLKGDDADTPGSVSSLKMSWRERRAQTRQTRETSLGEGPSSDGADALEAPRSAGRRPPSSSRRGGMRRASSERWLRAVEQTDGSEPSGVVQSRAARNNANSELSRSAHSIRRYHSGGLAPAGLDYRSYHGAESGRTPTGSRRTPRKAMRTPDSADSGGSFGDDYESYEMNLSGRSARTLDSIEDLEDFEHHDFQTPGMIDYDEEMIELMQRANPEHTAQLNRRVHRRREHVGYDQNMPLMTRQALLTRQASSQVTRGRFDGSNIDRRRLMMRSDSTNSMASNNDELSLSQHRQLRGTPGRRPPPRTKSSGMAAMSRGEHVPGFMQQPPRPSDPDDKRRLFRTKSGTNSFRQYTNKPNRVGTSRPRVPGYGDQIDPNSVRGTSSTAPPSDRRSALKRTQSMNAVTMNAVRRPASMDPRGKALTPSKPERRVPKSIETKAGKDDEPDLHSESSDSEGENGVKRKKAAKGDSSIASQSESEDSDVDSDDDPSPKKPAKRKPAKVTPIKASPSPSPAKKSTNKRDMTVKRNRRKLHSVVYQAKMGVDMRDLFKQVQKGEIPKSPIKTLMMASP